MARVFIGISCTILQFITVFIPFPIFCPSFYGFVYSILIILLLCTGKFRRNVYIKNTNGKLFFSLLWNLTAALNFCHLLWGKEALVENRLTKCYWTLFWVVLRMAWCVGFMTLLKIKLHEIPFNVYKKYFDGQTTDETELNQDDTLQSYNFVPFIACIQLFSMSKLQVTLYLLSADVCTKFFVFFSLNFTQFKNFFWNGVSKRKWMEISLSLISHKMLRHQHPS